MHFLFSAWRGLSKESSFEISFEQKLAYLFCAAVAAMCFVSVGTAKADSPTTAAKTFIETLSEDEARDALAPLNSSDRMEIRFTPGRRGGLSLKAMDAETLAAATRFLEETLSTDGMRMVELIRQREKILGEMTGNPGYRDHELYYLAVFGTPGRNTWGYRFEGHHLSINMTYRGDKLVSGVPIMLASNPEKTDFAGAPTELLGPIVKDARSSLDDLNARKRVIEAMTVHIPEPLRSTYRAGLINRKAFVTLKKTWKGLDLLGGRVELEIETNQTNHIHITFRDELWDFGGVN